MKNTLKWMKLVLVGALVTAPAFPQGGVSAKPLDEKVRHELIMLPFYDVFDSLSFRVDGDKVTLTGQVTRPTLKSDAERVAKRIPGVASVDNKIEVLPLSPYDSRVRWGVLRAVYGNSALFRYNLGPIAPIRIIVKNGDVSLEGFVASQFDKNVAGLAANGVPGVFSVTNNLQVKT